MKHITIAFAVGCLAGTLVNVLDNGWGAFLAIGLFAALFHWAAAQEDQQ